MAKKLKTYEELREDARKGKLKIHEAISFFPEAKECEAKKKKKE